MAVHNVSIKTGIDHERLSDLRDIEFPNTVRGYKPNTEPAPEIHVSQEEIRRILNSRIPFNTENTAYYDKDTFRRV